MPRADARAENVSISRAAPALLVMGNEGSGLRTNVRRACNRLVAIPAGINKAQGVDSLNVSVAAGILIHRCRLRESRRVSVRGLYSYF